MAGNPDLSREKQFLVRPKSGGRVYLRGLKKKRPGRLMSLFPYPIAAMLLFAGLLACHW